MVQCPNPGDCAGRPTIQTLGPIQSNLNTKHPSGAALVPLVVVMAALCVCLAAGQLGAQVRGVYPLGMSAVGGGVLPEAGFTYANLFLFYARDELRGPGGELLATGHNSVLMDMNIFTWASDTTTPRGRPRYAISVTLPIANNSLASDAEERSAVAAASLTLSISPPFWAGASRGRT